MQMKAKLTSQNHDLDTKYRLFVNIVASIFAGKMKVFRPTGYQELQAKPTWPTIASPSLKLPSPADPPFTNWLSIISIKNTDKK